MERKEFLKASLCLGALCGARLAAADEPTGQAPATASPSAPEPSPCERNAEFAHRWVRSFMENLDAQLSEPQRVALMEARGRACARGGATKLAEAHEGDLGGFIAAMASHMGPDGLRLEGNVVKVKYPTCYCPMVSEIKEPLSPTYCACSVGWLKEMYEVVTGKPATVEVLETVKRGGTACRFNVTLSA
jgi:hypothetical protein